MTGTELLRVANLITWKLKWINENDIVKIKVGDEANVEVDAYFKKEVQRSGYEYFNSGVAP
jgi:HlyD family secretion protein